MDKNLYLIAKWFGNQKLYLCGETIGEIDGSGETIKEPSGDFSNSTIKAWKFKEKQVAEIIASAYDGSFIEQPFKKGGVKMSLQDCILEEINRKSNGDYHLVFSLSSSGTVINIDVPQEKLFIFLGNYYRGVLNLASQHTKKAYPLAN